MMNLDLPLYPAMLVGSYALPAWFQTVQQHIRNDEFGALDVRETIEDATHLAVRDQVRAGMDVLCDGEMDRVHFTRGYYDFLVGLRPLPPSRKVGLLLYDAAFAYEAVERVTAPRGLGLLQEWERVRTFSEGRPVKIACAAPLTLTNAVTLRSAYNGSRDELVADLVGIVNRELRTITEAGVPIVQLDESTYILENTPPERMTETINACLEGIDRTKTMVVLHLCFGNLAGRPHSRRSYAPLMPQFPRINADAFQLEFANREGSELELWQRYGEGKILGAGVIDVKSFHRESAAEVKDWIQRARRYVPADKLWLNPDCGFFATPRWLAFRKMQALGEGARQARQEAAS